MATLCQIMQRHPHGPSLLGSQIPTLDCSLVWLPDVPCLPVNQKHCIEWVAGLVYLTGAWQYMKAQRSTAQHNAMQFIAARCSRAQQQTSKYSAEAESGRLHQLMMLVSSRRNAACILPLASPQCKIAQLIYCMQAESLQLQHAALLASSSTAGQAAAYVRDAQLDSGRTTSVCRQRACSCSTRPFWRPAAALRGVQRPTSEMHSLIADEQSLYVGREPAAAVCSAPGIQQWHCRANSSLRQRCTAQRNTAQQLTDNLCVQAESLRLQNAALLASQSKRRSMSETHSALQHGLIADEWHLCVGREPAAAVRGAPGIQQQHCTASSDLRQRCVCQAWAGSLCSAAVAASGHAGHPRQRAGCCGSTSIANGRKSAGE